MEKCLTYMIKDVDYLRTRGEGLIEIIKGWLKTKGFDIIVYDLVLEDNANIIIDYSFDENTDTKRLQDLTEQVFKRFNIDFELETD